MRTAFMGAPGANFVSCANLADRKSTRLNSSHLGISYAVFCLKKKFIKGDRKSTRLNSSHSGISYDVFCLKITKSPEGRRNGLPHQRAGGSAKITRVRFDTSLGGSATFFIDSATTEIFALTLLAVLPI